MGQESADTESPTGSDGSNEGSSGSRSSSSSALTQQTSNSRWLTPGHAGTGLAAEKAASSSSSGNSSQSDSPISVEQFPDDCTPRTSNRPLVSAYFDSSCNVMPIPFAWGGAKPEVTRHSSQQYMPHLPNNDHNVQPAVISQPSVPALPPPASVTLPPSIVSGSGDEPSRQNSARNVTPTIPLNAVTARRRNRLEDVVKRHQVQGTDNSVASQSSFPVREPSVTESMREEEELYARSQWLLQQPMIPREAYISNEERSLSPPTIDTGLQSIVSSARSTGSRMHFSVCSRTSNTSTPKRIPDNPSATIFIPIQPGIKAPLRRCREVQSALERDYYDTPPCSCCERQLAVIADAAFLYCPICQEISPLFGNIKAVGEYPTEPEYLRFGLGLGMTMETLRKVYSEIYSKSAAGPPASYNLR